MKRFIKLVSATSVVAMLVVGCGGGASSPATSDDGSVKIESKVKAKTVKKAILKAGEELGMRMLPVRGGVIMGEKFTGDGATVLEVYFSSNSFKVDDVSSDKYKDPGLADSLASKINEILTKDNKH